jgi:hypothetical protein
MMKKMPMVVLQVPKLQLERHKTTTRNNNQPGESLMSFIIIIIIIIIMVLEDELTTRTSLTIHVPSSGVCDLEINIRCDGCSINTTKLPLCEERPFRIGLLFRGGDCSENNFSQPLDRVSCADFPQNGAVPKLGTGGSVYIRANADPKDGNLGGTGGDSLESIFEGVVAEGSIYYMFAGGNRMPADTQILFLLADGPQDSSTVLQDVRFDASCSQPFLLNNIFGSHQLISFENQLQGNVTLFAAATTDFNISIPITGLNIGSGDDILTISAATIRTNYTTPPLTNLDALIGQRLCPHPFLTS